MTSKKNILIFIIFAFFAFFFLFLNPLVSLLIMAGYFIFKDKLLNSKFSKNISDKPYDERKTAEEHKKVENNESKGKLEQKNQIQLMTENLLERKNKIANSQSLHYINYFIDNYIAYTNYEDYYQEVIKLKNLLQVKGCQLKDRELDVLIYQEVNRKNLEMFDKFLKEKNINLSSMKVPKETINSMIRKSIITNSQDLHYINYFVDKFTTNIDSEDYCQEVIKLKNLLQVKGYQLDYRDLDDLIYQEINRKNIDIFEKLMNSNMANKVDDYFRNYVRIFCDNQGQDNFPYLDIFDKFLKEKNVNLSMDKIKEMIKDLIQKEETLSFEKKLVSSHHTKNKISIEKINSMSGYDFEFFLATLLEKMGYGVEHTKLSNDQGADFILHKLGTKIVVQAKHYSGKVGNSAIQEVVASIKYYKANGGMVIATNEFTNSAKDLADANNIDLIDTHELKKIINKFY
ncbi:MAG: hypothetical protein UR78_C0018G0016 [Candidatus Moranbacteria bacterium GW2011_GWF2_35_39]|nr:MAG: hypothetical protein UR78_C0018G0016 [Candidatus Moranbacteria bacterium GW2011_GWF2_35_39]